MFLFQRMIDLSLCNQNNDVTQIVYFLILKMFMGRRPKYIELKLKLKLDKYDGPVTEKEN